MAYVLRQLLDSGKLSEETCHSILRGLGKLVDDFHLSKTEEEVDDLHLSKTEEEVDDLHLSKTKEEVDDLHLSKTEEEVDDLHLSKTEEEEDDELYLTKIEDDGWTSDEEEELDEEYCRQVNESMGFDIDRNVRIPAIGITPYFVGERKPRSETALYGRLGVHCFNIDTGRKLQYKHIPKYNVKYPYGVTYYITVEVKDLADNSPHTFQTLVTRTLSRDFRVSTRFCRIKPEAPEDENITLVDENAIDEFYRGSMPDFVSKARADDDKLRFYEVQEQDICENDWLRLYTEFALFRIWECNEEGFESCLPVENKKIVVETCETHREQRLKLKSRNAIFHIKFSAKGRDYKSVVRRATDGILGHIVLEVNSWFDQPSST